MLPQSRCCRACKISEIRINWVSLPCSTVAALWRWKHGLLGMRPNKKHLPLHCSCSTFHFDILLFKLNSILGWKALLLLMVVAFTVRHFRPSANLESTSPALPRHPSHRFLRDRDQALKSGEAFAHSNCFQAADQFQQRWVVDPHCGDHHVDPHHPPLHRNCCGHHHGRQLFYPDDSHLDYYSTTFQILIGEIFKGWQRQPPSLNQAQVRLKMHCPCNVFKKYHLWFIGSGKFVREWYWKIIFYW